jgi:cellulose biosynthesis protein BcsQ
MNHIFADNLPTWTNKEVLFAFGSAAGVLFPAFFTLYRLLSAGLRHRLRAERKHIELLSQELENIKAKQSPSVELKLLLDDARKQAENLSNENHALLHDSAVLREDVDAHKIAAETLSADLNTIQDMLGAERRRIVRALDTDGFTWTERVRHNAPDFRSLDERRMPIISVLNLKGGVGKTTVTANLGAALCRRGWKVLLIDIDLQGSLTSLYVPEEEQAIMEHERRLVGDFLSRSFDAEYPNLLNYTRPILEPSASALVATVDTLAYAEMNLTIRWLLREGNRDPRFLLRRELHLKRISHEFDIVLIDCPPLINISCVNALAASDTVLVPVMPSKQAIDRVPVLLTRVLQFRENINEHLKLLGFVANRTFRAELTTDEKNRMSELEVKAKNAWGETVTRFETNIRQSPEIKTAEDEHRPLTEDAQLADAFQSLAREVEDRLPTFCRGTGNATLARTEVVQ